MQDNQSWTSRYTADRIAGMALIGIVILLNPQGKFALAAAFSNNILVLELK